MALVCDGCDYGVRNTGIGHKRPGRVPLLKNYDLLPGLDKQLIDTIADPCVDFFQYRVRQFQQAVSHSE